MQLRLILIAVTFAALPVQAQTPETTIVVQSVSSRSEIQRILAADNLDTANLDARSVADSIALIERGRAPEDFWAAYQIHVRAWQKLAAAEEFARVAMEDPGKLPEAAALLAEAEEQIDITFTAVERIALDYGARLPIPLNEFARTA